MEESEKRRERLKAMRMEAARGGDSGSSGMPSHALSNPLIESDNAAQYAPPRFDYYTDPMAAFSGRRRPNVSPQVSQAHYNPPPRPIYRGMTPPPPPAYQHPPPHPRMFQQANPRFNHGPLPSPMEAHQNPRPSWRGPRGNPPNSWGGPHQNPRPSWRGPRGSPPNSWGGPHNTFNRGRGRGRSSSGRGGRPHESVSAEERPDLYYSKEMVEDPWKMLEPVVWKGVTCSDSDKHRLPESTGVKKAKVSSEAPQVSISQPSLAEYLAALSNDESINEEAGS